MFRNIHWAGKFDGKEENLPQREHPEGYVPFREVENMKIFAVIANVIAVVLFVPLFITLTLRAGHVVYSLAGCILALAFVVPHEFLHAVWFREDAYIYNNLKQGMLFVVGTEDMSKARFIIMSLFPNIVFGLMPYIFFMIFPQIEWLGMLGVLSIAMGVGDYYNVFHAATQMPANALTYLSGFHSYWYVKKN